MFHFLFFIFHFFFLLSTFPSFFSARVMAARLGGKASTSPAQKILSAEKGKDVIVRVHASLKRGTGKDPADLMTNE